MIGIDEVGRGCWAGPLLVVAARQTSELPKGLKDSKKLSKKQREVFYDQLKTTCEFGEGWVSPAEIDQLGLTAAMRLGVKRALHSLRAESAEQIILDGTSNYVDSNFTNVECHARADDLFPIVSAAAIYAKVTRDRYMSEVAHSNYPGYQFDVHVGYGTAVHAAMLALHGVCDLHRKSYKPIQIAIAAK